MSVEVIKENKNINPWLACLPTMASAFMFVLDETIANVALPHMAGSFSVSREESMWILTSYLIASGKPSKGLAKGRLLSTVPHFLEDTGAGDLKIPETLQHCLPQEQKHQVAFLSPPWYWSSPVKRDELSEGMQGDQIQESSCIYQNLMF